MNEQTTNTMFGHQVLAVAETAMPTGQATGTLSRVTSAHMGVKYQVKVTIVLGGYHFTSDALPVDVEDETQAGPALHRRMALTLHEAGLV